LFFDPYSIQIYIGFRVSKWISETNFKGDRKMLLPTKCEIRKCKHYLGVIQPDGTEMTETNYCEAFLDGIPVDIAYGDNKHLTPEPDQENDIVYEKS
jgi:hypothetical protein